MHKQKIYANRKEIQSLV